LTPRLAASPPIQADLTSERIDWLLLGLGLMTGMEFYTADSMNLVLPDITGALGVSFDEGSWLLTVYSCALFLAVPISIWAAGYIGHKRFLLGSIALFALASLGCSVAPDLVTMLGWRAVQGLAGGGLYVWWRASIYMLLPKSQRSPSLMRVSTLLYLSSVAGLLLSGYLTDEFNWRLIFLPNLVLACAAAWLLWRYFPDESAIPSAGPSGFDGWGIALICAVVVSVQLILSRGPVDDWFGSSLIQALAWTAVIALGLFIYSQISPLNRAPLLCVHLLRDRLVMSSALLGIFTGLILSASLFALPEFLRNIDPEPHSATHTGRIMCVYALTAAAIRPLVVPLVARLGQRKTIVFALVMLVSSMLLFSRLLTLGTPDSAYLLPLVLYAFCLAPLLPSVGSGTVARIDQSKLLDGVTLYMTFRQLGAAFGVALVTIVLDWRETLHSARLFDHLRTASDRTGAWLHTASIVTARGGYSPLESQHAAVRLLAGAGERQAATLAYADAFLFMAAVGVVALCLVPVIPPTPVARK
jgi:MFS transporter, DHA2 family, multidrug resistance protein